MKGGGRVAHIQLKEMTHLSRQEMNWFRLHLSQLSWLTRRAH